MIIYSLIFFSYRKRDKDKMYNKTSFLLGWKKETALWGLCRTALYGLYADFVEISCNFHSS